MNATGAGRSVHNHEADPDEIEYLEPHALLAAAHKLLSHIAGLPAEYGVAVLDTATAAMLLAISNATGEATSAILDTHTINVAIKLAQNGAELEMIAPSLERPQ